MDAAAIALLCDAAVELVRFLFKRFLKAKDA